MLNIRMSRTPIEGSPGQYGNYRRFENLRYAAPAGQARMGRAARAPGARCWLLSDAQPAPPTRAARPFYEEQQSGNIHNESQQI